MASFAFGKNLLQMFSLDGQAGASVPLHSQGDSEPVLAHLLGGDGPASVGIPDAFVAGGEGYVVFFASR